MSFPTEQPPPPPRSAAARGLAMASAAIAVLAWAATAATPSQEPAPARPGEATQEQGKAKPQDPDALNKQIERLQKEVDRLRRETGKGAARKATIPAYWTAQLRWRPIGPAGMGGRITAISVFEADPSCYWVATAGCGLLKTENRGVTFAHQLDREATSSIGDVCVAPSDRNIVYAGTGEGNPRNSVSYGDGVYKSTDGGQTWANVGLRKSYQIGRVVVHPTDPDVAYVGALGRLYGPSEERGLYKTADGGQTWERVLAIDDNTGVIDIAMHPKDPDTLLVATWERRRDEFDSYRGEPAPPDGYNVYDPSVKWGDGSGIHKTTDGGRTWRRLGNGLPTCNMGRIGLDYYRKDPDVVYAIIDTEKIGMGTPPSPLYLGVRGQDAVDGARITEVIPDGPADEAGLKPGDVVKSADGRPIAGYVALADLARGRNEGDAIALQVGRDGQAVAVTLTLRRRPYGLREEGANESNLPILLGGRVRDEEVGVRITEIYEDYNADVAGLHEGDLIVEVDGKPLDSPEQLLLRLRRGFDGDKVKLRIRRGNEALDEEMTLLPLSYANPNRPYSALYGGQASNIQDRQGPESREYGGVYKSTDGGESWTRVNSLNPRPMYFSQVRVDPNDDRYVYVLGVYLYRSSDGGRTFKPDGSGEIHQDQHALWIDPKDGRHMIVGTDGGFYVTYDRMENWEHLNNMAIGQFYHVTFDSSHPYRVFGGMQDNGSWGGPSRSLEGSGPINADWFTFSGGDGFVCRVDPFDPDLVYFETQNGFMARRNLHTGEQIAIRPAHKAGFRNYFNWNTPFILSSHNPGIFYTAGTVVYRSVKRGERLEAISPPIARTGRGTASALAESPLNPDILWVGTDDGNIWVSRDGGDHWNEVRRPGELPGPYWVASLEPSRFAEGRCYVAFDTHRSDEEEPSVFVTENFGKTWRSLRADLPEAPTRVLREDLKNPDLLYCGTEFAVYASIDRGRSWAKINNNLPTVAVHELAQHPTSGEMIAATHGRSLWILDVTTLRQMTPDAIKSPVTLFEPNTVVRWRAEPRATARSATAPSGPGRELAQLGPDRLRPDQAGRVDRPEGHRRPGPSAPRAPRPKRGGPAHHPLEPDPGIARTADARRTARRRRGGPHAAAEGPDPAGDLPLRPGLQRPGFRPGAPDRKRPHPAPGHQDRRGTRRGDGRGGRRNGNGRRPPADRLRGESGNAFMKGAGQDPALTPDETPSARRALDLRIASRSPALPKAASSSFSTGERASSWLRTANSCIRALSWSVKPRSRM
ncbi:MAG: PDZ domain-containing protein [Isosphaeraceae bacterium]